MISQQTGQDQQAGEWVQSAPAKINLGLKILGRRDDGYHDICSIAQTVDLVDQLRIQEAVDEVANGAEHVTLTCSDPNLSAGPDNLVQRAVSLFQAQVSSKPRFLRLHLDKRIPMGAGLGGGSAAAAAALRGLNIMYGRPLTGEQLSRLGAQLGSDVPFQLVGGTALLRGRGEVLEPLSFTAEVDYVLVYPGIHVSTAWAYDHLAAEGEGDEGDSLTANRGYLSFVASLSGGCVDHEDLFRCLENDFAPLVERTYPIVATLSSYLLSAGAVASSMSGSGSTIFGVFDDRTAACEAYRSLAARGYRSFLCRPVDETDDAV